MTMATKFVINKIVYGHYLQTGDKESWTAYIEKAKTFNTYADAEKALESLSPGFYQIDKIFRLK